MEQFGDSSIDVTMDRGGHLPPSADQATTDALGEGLSERFSRCFIASLEQPEPKRRESPP